MFISTSQSPLKSWSSSSPATHNPNAKYLGINNDEFAQFPPTHDLERFCSSYPERPVKKHHILISNKAKGDRLLKIFYWKQESLSQEIDWHKESETMCPVLLELQSFFYHYRQTTVKDPSMLWKTGYAPCFFWKTWDNEIEDRPGSCWPTKTGRLSFFEESIGYYPHVAMPAFLNQFNLTMGSLPQLMGVPNPSYPITEKKAFELAHIEHTHPFDKTPEHYIAFITSNCATKNDRMGLIDKLVNTSGAHSYGFCGHNKEMLEELKGRVAGSWQTPTVWDLSLKKIYDVYDVYASGSISIYMGAPGIADFVPEGSYIDVRNFKTYDDLIHYMKTVDREPLYWWKLEGYC
ncbi:4-alpha-L-fucosyltransferase [Linnemannia hyalina]|uniref:Fucosyltransferase n=1 Tax=Linnemannia hyalina TaxID=64524 RepID=A0A9P7XU48_9FUNG|nr:4-alpha-L-fucosyltransferase [Linnemannia hyalina]